MMGSRGTKGHDETPFEPGDDLHEAFRSIFGEEDGKYFDELFAEVGFALANWTMLEFIHELSDEESRAFQRSGPGFFAMAQTSMFYDVIMTICRLTDPVQSGRKKANTNLSIQYLKVLGQEGDWPEHLTRLIGEATNSAKPIRRFRDKHLAHRDLQSLRSGKRYSVTAGQCGEALEKIMLVLNELCRTYGGAEFAFANRLHVDEMKGLTTVLKRGLAAKESDPHST